MNRELRGRLLGIFSRWLLAAGIAVLLFSLIVKTTITEGFLGQVPQISLAVTPTSADAMSALSERAMQTGSPDIGPENHRLLLDSLSYFPITAAPFMLAGAEALERQDPRRAEGFLREAVRRDPRLRQARLLLVDAFIRNGDVAHAAAEIDVLSRLLPEANPLLIYQLGLLAQDRSTRAAVARTVSDPRLLDLVLLYMVQHRVPTDDILDFARQSGRLRSTGTGQDWQPTLLQQLATDGSVDEAYRAWRQFTPQAPDNGGGIYDIGFAGLPGAAPFNWRLIENATGAASIASRGTLDVEFYGRENTELVTQLLMLAPGSYELSMSVEGNATGEGAHLLWQVDCAGGPSGLLSMPLANVGAEPRRVAGRFTVPANACRGQWLRLLGVAAEFPATQTVEVSGLRLARVGGGE